MDAVYVCFIEILAVIGLCNHFSLVNIKTNIVSNGHSTWFDVGTMLNKCYSMRAQ